MLEIPQEGKFVIDVDGISPEDMEKISAVWRGALGVTECITVTDISNGRTQVFREDDFPTWEEYIELAANPEKLCRVVGKEEYGGWYVVPVVRIDSISERPFLELEVLGKSKSLDMLFFCRHINSLFVKGKFVLGFRIVARNILISGGNAAKRKKLYSRPPGARVSMMYE